MRALMLARYGGPEATELRDGVPMPSEKLVEVRLSPR